MSNYTQKTNIRTNRVRQKLETVCLGLPRLSVYKSNRHIFAQVINDKNGNILAAYHSQTIKQNLSQKEKADKVGQMVAKLAIKNKVKNVKFDRGSYRYHGCVKILADSARKAGLIF